MNIERRLKPRLRFARNRWWCGLPNLNLLWWSSAATPLEAYQLWKRSLFWNGVAK